MHYVVGNQYFLRVHFLNCLKVPKKQKAPLTALALIPHYLERKIVLEEEFWVIGSVDTFYTPFYEILKPPNNPNDKINETVHS